MTVGRWYYVWAIIDQTTDTFDVYLGSSSDMFGASLVKENSAFRNGTTADLVTFMGLGNGENGWMDDMAIVPEPTSMLLLGLGGLVTVRRRR